jgi:type IV secretion system protein VirD4
VICIDKRKDEIVFLILLIVPVIWFGLLIAPYMGKGLLYALPNLNEAISHPFQITL